MRGIHICALSGDLLTIPRRNSNEITDLESLQKYPRVSTWDMTEKWKGNTEIWRLLKSLLGNNLIEIHDEPYPWHRYKLTKLGMKLVS